MGLILAFFALLYLIPVRWLGVINESLDFRLSAKIGFWCLAGLVGTLTSFAFVIGFFSIHQDAHYGIEVPVNVLFLGAPTFFIAGFGVNAIAKYTPAAFSNLLTGLTASLWISCILFPFARIVLMEHLTSRFNMHFQP
jgi:hypothetical protein